MPRLVGFAVSACLAGLMLAGPAAASKRIYSYDSANALTEQMTEAGLTFVFDRTFISTRVLRILETHDIGSADLKPASEGELGRAGRLTSNLLQGVVPGAKNANNATRG